MNRIGVFDSGIGGFSILDKLREVLPDENYLYYGDSKNCPYGEKSDSDLLDITRNIVDYLVERDCKMVVIACNTATTKCIKKLRELYPTIIFIGTEPAIKVACDNNYKNTLLMATPQTICSKRVEELIRDNKRDDQNIYLVPCLGLADAIENKDQDMINSILNNVLSKYKNSNIDSIVLGCTHYPFVSKEILNILPNVSLIDGSMGVARYAKYQLEKNNILNNDSIKGDLVIVNSKDDNK